MDKQQESWCSAVDATARAYISNRRKGGWLAVAITAGGSGWHSDRGGVAAVEPTARGSSRSNS
jgi:hypothetical protein